MAFGVADALLFPFSAPVALTGALAGKKGYYGLSDLGSDLKSGFIGDYGYGYDPTQDLERISSWEAMRRADLDKNSMSNLVGQRYSQIGDEARAAGEAATQSAMDRQMQYGTTGSGLERTARQGQHEQLNTWAGVQQAKADALLAAQQQDLAAKRDLEDRVFSAKQMAYSNKQGSWGRQGSWFT